MRQIQILALICILGLTACGSGNTADNVTEDLNSEQENTNTTNPANTTETTTDPLSADQVLDNELFQDAIQSLDATKCDSISNSEMKQECDDAIQGLSLTETAKSEKNVSKCSEISLDRFKTACENAVNDLIEQDNLATQAAEDRKSNLSELASLEQQAVNDQNPSICDQINDENVKYSCRYNVIVNQAIQENNPALCEQIGEASFTADCKGQF